jgi:lipopolysaccharide transport protein LptA
MKTLGPFFFLLAVATILVAQTNPTSAVKISTNREPTHIYADQVEMSVKDRTAVYSGNVRVVDPQMKMTCDLLTARMITNSTKFESIVAESNVVIDGVDSKGEPAHATANKLVYTYKIVDSVTNETIELTGKPRLTNSMGAFIGEPIKWDITTGRITSRDHTTVINTTTNTLAPILEKTTGEKK